MDRIVSYRGRAMCALVFATVLLGQALAMENWPPFWVGPDGDYTRSRAAQIVIPNRPIVTKMLFEPIETDSYYCALFAPSVYADGTSVIASVDGYHPPDEGPFTIWCVSADLALKWQTEVSAEGRPELFPGPDNTLFLNCTSSTHTSPGQTLACFSLLTGEELWSTSATINDMYYALSDWYEADPLFHVIDRGADVGPDGVLYGWTGVGSTGYSPPDSGALLAVSTTGTIAVLDHFENPEDSPFLNGICMIRAAGQVALSVGGSFYDYSYDPVTSQFECLSRWPFSVRPLVRPILFPGGTIAILGTDFLFSTIDVYLWQPEQPPLPFVPATDIRPCGRVFCNTGRVMYAQQLYLHEGECGVHIGTYRAYVDGELAWDARYTRPVGHFWGFIYFVDQNDTTIWGEGSYGYNYPVVGYELIQSDWTLDVVSKWGEILWRLNPGVPGGWVYRRNINIAPAPDGSIRAFTWPLTPWHGRECERPGLCSFSIEEAGHSDAPALISLHSFMVGDTLVLCAGLFSDRILLADFYSAMRTPSGRLLFLPSLSASMSPMLSRTEIPSKELFLPRILREFEIGTEITESGTYTFYALLVDSNLGNLASNLAQATVSVIVPKR